MTCHKFSSPFVSILPSFSNKHTNRLTVNRLRQPKIPLNRKIFTAYYILHIILNTYQYIDIRPLMSFKKRDKKFLDYYSIRPLKLLIVNVKLTPIRLTMLTVNDCASIVIIFMCFVARTFCVKIKLSQAMPKLH